MQQAGSNSTSSGGGGAVGGAPLALGATANPGMQQQQRTTATIKPIASQRSVLITRSRPNAGGGVATTGGGVGVGGNSTISSTSITKKTAGVGALGGGPGIGGGAGSLANAPGAMQTNASNVKQGREKEKQDMRELNSRFASYIEKGRFLEAQNRRLTNELKALKEAWGKETEKIKQMYAAEMDQLRQLQNEETERGRQEVRGQTLEDQIEELQGELAGLEAARGHLQQKTEAQDQRLGENDKELGVARRRITALEDERARDKKEVQRLRDELKRVRADLEQETLAHVNAENSAQALKDEIDFLKQVHESQMKEMEALVNRDSTAENRDFWRHEMSQALADIQADYDKKLEATHAELESHFQLKLQEIRTNQARSSLPNAQLKEENTRVKTQLSELRNKLADSEGRMENYKRMFEEAQQELAEKQKEHEAELRNTQDELDAVNNELKSVIEEMNDLLDAKLSLEMEIQAYRKLLDCEDMRQDDEFGSVSFGGSNGGGAAGDTDSNALLAATASSEQIFRDNIKPSSTTATTDGAGGMRSVHEPVDKSHEQSMEKPSPPGLASSSGVVQQPIAANNPAFDAGNTTNAQHEEPLIVAANAQKQVECAVSAQPANKGGSSVADSSGNRSDGAGAGRAGAVGTTDSAGNSATDKTETGFGEKHAAEITSLAASALENTQPHKRAKTSFKKSTKGNAAIKECSPDGKSITLENIGSVNEDLSGFQLIRDVDSSSKVIKFEFPNGSILDLDAKKTIKVWAKGERPVEQPDDLEIAEDSWGIGLNVETKLLSKAGEEKATHSQMTTFED